MSVYLTPGPSEPYPKLRKFVDDALSEDIVAISHRGKAFTDIYKRTDSAIRELMGVPESYTLMFLGSATEAMERTIQGVVEKRSHHFVSGAFSGKWKQIAGQLGKETSASTAFDGKGFAAAEYQIPDDAELVCLTQNETSTGVMMPSNAIARVIKPGGPLVALDVVSSAPMVPIDWNGLDLAFFSVQKAFGLPAGLGVLISSPRSLARAAQLKERGSSVGSYHNLTDLASAAAKFQTPATPNVLGIYLLGKVAEDMLERGIRDLRDENRRRALQLYKALDTSESLKPFVDDPYWRSQTVLVTDVTGGNGYLHGHLSEKGLIVGKGYNNFKDNHLRIANFPALSQTAFDALVSHLVQFSGARV